MSSRKPVVLIPACNQQLGEHPFHIAGVKYVAAARLAGALPMIVPSLQAGDLDAVLDMADGLMLTGSPSNVEPSRYGQPTQHASLPLDTERDAAVLPLVLEVLARGIPLLAICRGAQEVNVALGGTLHQSVHTVPGRSDHRAEHGQPADVQYGPAHTVQVLPGGLLARTLSMSGDGPSLAVNSLHGQGVDRLAVGLRAEALAPDGLVEAFSAPDAPGFNLCVQWHPEWRAADNPASMRILRAFGDAVRQYRDRVRGPLPELALTD